MRLINRQNGNGKPEPTIRHMLVPFTDTPEDRELLRFACRVAQAFKAKLTAVYVLEVPRAMRVDDPNVPGVEEGEKILDVAESIMEEMGVANPDVEMLLAHHAGHAIVEEALQQQVDTILIEAHQRQRLGITLLGDTVNAVLRKAHCHVWVHRSPFGEVK